MHTETRINALGLRCPLPLMRAKSAYQKLMPGESITVLADDPQVPHDFESYTNRVKAKLVWNESNGVFTLVMTRLC